MTVRRATGPLAVAAGLGLTLALGGCGGATPAATHVTSPSTSSATTTSSATHTSATTATAPHRGHRLRSVTGPPVGAHQTVGTHGADLSITVLRVLALTGTGSPAAPGMREVGVLLRIANDAGQTYDSTASGDVSLIISGTGQVLPLLVRHGVCTTPLVDFESMIVSGDVRSGCVAFTIPTGARVLGVRFSPHSRPAGALTWRAGG